MKNGMLLCCLLVSLVLLGTGCHRERRLKGVVPCAGKVTLNGEPLAGAAITFSPVGGFSETQHNSAARTGDDGAFVTMTLNPGDGIFPGDYNVTITKIILVDSKGNPTEEETGVPKFLVPKKYLSPTTSGIQVSIPKEGKKDILIELVGTAGR